MLKLTLVGVFGLELRLRRGDFHFIGVEVGLLLCCAAASDLSPRFWGVESPLDLANSQDFFDLMAKIESWLAMAGIVIDSLFFWSELVGNAFGFRENFLYTRVWTKEMRTTNGMFSRETVEAANSLPRSRFCVFEAKVYVVMGL